MLADYITTSIPNVLMYVNIIIPSKLR